MIAVVFLGPPGSGKGTQAQALVRERGMTKLSTGDLLRQAVHSGTELGQRVKSVMESGGLVSDEIVTDLIARHLDCSDSCAGFIFDGYPRTREQLESLDSLLESRGLTLSHVIDLLVDEEALITRISGRFSCSSCETGYHDQFKKPAVEGVCDKCGGTKFHRRPDDSADTVRMRLAEYHKKTAPILPIYKERGLVRSVDGAVGIDKIHDEIAAIMDGAYSLQPTA